MGSTSLTDCFPAVATLLASRATKAKWVLMDPRVRKVREEIKETEVTGRKVIRVL